MELEMDLVFGATKIPRRWCSENMNGSNDRPHPGPLLQEREKRLPRLGNIMRRDWPDDLPTAGNLAPLCPLLGERKQVREVVKTNEELAPPKGRAARWQS